MANKIKEFHDEVVAFMAGYKPAPATPKLVSVPVQSGTLTYSGAAKTPTWSGYDSTQLTIGGTTSATNAGTYTATFTPKSGYTWTDGTVSPKNVSWTIGKADNDLTLSATSGTVTYGTPKTFTVTNNASGGALSVTSASTTYATATISGTTVTVNCVQYRTATTTITVTSAATANYNAAIATYVVTAAKATPNLTFRHFSPSDGVQRPPEETTYLEFDSTTNSGSITVTSSNEAVATISDFTVHTAEDSHSFCSFRINCIKAGTATITVSQSSDTNHNATSATFTVRCREPKLITDSWETISTRSKNGTAASYYDIGDYKEITLNGNIGDYLTLNDETLRVFILHINLPMNGVAENNIIWGGFKTADGTDVALCDSKYATDSTDGAICFNMNHQGQTTDETANGYCGTNYGGWKGTDLRYDILGATSIPPSEYNSLKSPANVGYNATAATLKSPKANTLLAALPADFRNALRLWSRWIDAKGNSSKVEANIEETIDAVTLLTRFESNDGAVGTNRHEQEHQVILRYFASKNEASLRHFLTLKRVNNFAPSPSRTDGSRFVNRYTSPIIISGMRAAGIAPAFKT